MTANARSYSAASGFASLLSPPNPALLTRMSTGLAVSASRLATRAVSFSSDRSAASTSTERPSAPQLGGHRIQALLVAGDQHQVVAAGRQLPRELGADARCAAGDESDTHAPYDTVQVSTVPDDGVSAPHRKGLPR